MEDISPPSSDSDAYNTESARLYFGPLKTPERNFVDNSKGLFPTTQTTCPRRSPRLSSPRPRSPSQQKDNEDVDFVAQLINTPGANEEHFSDSAGPQAGDGVEDGLSQSEWYICYFSDSRLLRTIIRIGRQSYARNG